MEHLAYIADVYSFAFWPLIVAGFVLSNDPNVRWTLLLFSALSFFGYILSIIVRELLPDFGWLYHLAQVGSALLVVYVLVIFRPVISSRLGSFLAVLPVVGVWLAHILPSTYRAKLYPEELAIRRLYIGYVVTHCMVLSHYALYALGVMSDGGLFDRYGVHSHIVFNTAYAAHLLLMMLELLLLASLIYKGLRLRFAMRA